MQYGTARIIHNIPLGNRVKTRISKEEYGGRLQAEENGVNIESDEETDDEFGEVPGVCIPDDGDLARFRSAGGEMGPAYLGLIPKESRFEMKPLLPRVLQTHLFSISMRLRMGMAQQPDKAQSKRGPMQMQGKAKGGQKRIQCYG